MLPGSIPPGSRLGGYRILEELGRGGMGVVLKAEEESLGRIVAIKVLPRDLVSDAKRLERFRREAKGAAAVVHPNITTLYAHGEANGWPYIAFEFMAGGSVWDKVKKTGPLPWREVARIGAEVAHALGAIHGAGLIHRDLKPANILLDASGRAKLGDFGLVRQEKRGNSLTGVGELVGTAAFLAPEQAGEGGIDHRADLYALGATLYAMVTGAPPFDGEGLSVIAKHLTARPSPPSDDVAGLPKAFDRLILRLLEKKPEARGDEAEDVARELEALLVEKSERAPAAAAPSRGPLIAGALIGLGGLAAAAVVFALGSSAKTAPPPPPPPPAGPTIELEIAEPRENATAYPGAKVRVHGTARSKPPGPVAVTANGHALLVKDDAFDGEIELGSSTKTVFVSATCTGAERHRDVKLHFEDAPPWWKALAEDQRPPLPLPEGLTWSDEKKAFLVALDGPVAPLELVYVPAGDFTMGTHGVGSGNKEDEPAHAHEMKKGYYIARYETTIGQWAAFCVATKREPWKKPFAYTIEPHEDDPIVDVAHQDVKKFCEWARVRLPMEAEWEKAARGTDGRLYPWGGQETEGEVSGQRVPWNPGWKVIANFCGLEWRGAKTNGPGGQSFLDPAWPQPHVKDGHLFTAPVGTYKDDVSPYGCYDMGGNAAELCEDFYESHVYVRYAKGDFRPPVGVKHVVRGGAFCMPWWACRATSRPSGSALGDEATSVGTGFRVARDER